MIERVSNERLESIADKPGDTSLHEARHMARELLDARKQIANLNQDIEAHEFNWQQRWEAEREKREKAEQHIKELIRAIKEHREAIHSGRITVHEADARLWALETQQTPAARAAGEER